MNDFTNKQQRHNNVLSPKQKDKELSSQTAPSVPYPCTITVGDTAVHLSFSDSGDLNTRLANAFNAMLQ